MGIRVGFITLLILGFSTAACTSQRSSQLSTSVLARDGKSCEDGRGETSRCKQSKMKNDTFIVFYGMDYGYRLSTVDDTDTFIVPEFIGAGVEKEFNDFFVSDEFARSAGKKIYCDCSGESYHRDGVRFYRVETARIYAK